MHAPVLRAWDVVAKLYTELSMCGEVVLHQLMLRVEYLRTLSCNMMSDSTSEQWSQLNQLLQGLAIVRCSFRRLLQNLSLVPS